MVVSKVFRIVRDIKDSKTEIFVFFDPVYSLALNARPKSLRRLSETLDRLTTYTLVV